MSISIRINDEFYQQAKIQAKATLRTTPSQIEYWAKIGRAAIDNPDLPIDIIEKLLVAKNEESETFKFIE
jgi:hypothetical protein